jgi:hypothetical protein
MVQNIMQFSTRPAHQANVIVIVTVTALFPYLYPMVLYGGVTMCQPIKPSPLAVHEKLKAYTFLKFI